MFGKKKKRLEISAPSNFEHRVHTGFDPREQKFTGLPQQWQSLLADTANRPKPMVDPSYITPIQLAPMKVECEWTSNGDKSWSFSDLSLTFPHSSVPLPLPPTPLLSLFELISVHSFFYPPLFLNYSSYFPTFAFSLCIALYVSFTSVLQDLTAPSSTCYTSCCFSFWGKIDNSPVPSGHLTLSDCPSVWNYSHTVVHYVALNLHLAILGY